MRAPSASADSFAQTTDGATALLTNAKVAKPQSAPAITRSRPTMSAYWQIRCATSRGCSTKLVVEPMTPGIRILSSGIFAPCISPDSCAWRGLAASNDNPAGRARMHTSRILASGMSWVRAFVVSPAQMHAHRLRRGVGGRLVERGYIALGNAQELALREVLILVVPGRAEIGRINLKDEPRARDRLV